LKQVFEILSSVKLPSIE
jgi:hypothetical protein